VFGPDVPQEQLFGDVLTPLMERFVNGQSCVLFAYGITNAGKTHTIQGTAKQPGILPRLVESLLERTTKDSQGTDLQLGMYEIYQEKIFDLLNRRNKLALRDTGREVELPELTYHKVTSAESTLKILAKGSSKRSSGKTLLNIGSSRSHAVYTLMLRGEVFQIVDLAGAERK
jgi:kinesin family member 22